jgi:hypothetical protein
MKKKIAAIAKALITKKAAMTAVLLVLTATTATVGVQYYNTYIANHSDSQDDDTPSPDDFAIESGDVPAEMTDTNSIEDQENIYISGFVDCTVTASTPYIVLRNLEDNTVYITYTISEGGSVIYETKAVSPGNVHNWNAYETLKTKGEHTVKISMTTNDVETLESCNSASQTIVITVE